MTENEKISVIIPVYNVERYLESCLKSVTGQTYGNVEIILVNDGSTDNSGAICDRWSKKDDRISVVHKKNEGLNYARKSGWKVSTGLYITFLDSDDMIHPVTLESSLKALIANSVDMTVFMHLEFSDEDEKNRTINPLITEECDVKRTTEDVFKFLICNGYDNIYPMTAWGKLYRRRLIENIDWSKSNMRAYEDNFFTPQIFDNVKSFAVLKKQLYLYRRNQDNSVLSRMLTGNNLNKKPVGYLEYMSIMKSYWQSLLDKHSIDLTSELDELCYTNEIFRLNNLIEADLLSAENNSSFAGNIIKKLQQRLNSKIKDQEDIINDQSIRLQDCTSTIGSLEAEISRLHTTRGAVNNVVSSIKNTATKH